MENTSPYAKLCSQQTLQTKSEGFFDQLVEQVAPFIDPEQLLNCKSDLDRIRYCSSASWDSVRAELIFKGKNEEEAVQKRLDGNKAFERGDLRRALLLYCQSVVRAPPGPELAYVYSNRSTLFEKMGEYEAAISDAEMAIVYDYPENSRHKLYERMTNCYLHLRNPAKAKVTFMQATHLAKQNQADEKFYKKLEKLKERLDAIQFVKQDLPQSNNHNEGQERSQVFPNASPKFSVQSDQSVGRFAVAGETIKTGEEILREKPYASCLLTDRMGTHCLHCFARLKAAIACETCANVVFCSKQCRTEAEKYHKYECRILALLIGAGMSILAHLALRIITQSTAGEMVRKISRLSSTPLEVLLNGKGQFEDSYENVHNLVALEDQRSGEGFLERCVMSLFLMKCLRLVGYYEEFGLNLFKNQKPTEQEMIIGSMILRNLQVLQFNAYEICEFRMESRKHFRNSKSYNLGVGIYNTASFINHSCAPNVTRHFDGTSLVIQSIQEIPKGQAILDNYGPYFTKMRKAERQYKLKGRYWFDCACKACEEDLPPLNEFPMDLVQGSNKFENQILLQLQKLDKNFFEKAVTIMDTGNSLVAIEYLKKYLDDAGNLINKVNQSRQEQQPKNPEPFLYKSFYLAQEALKLCLASQGSVYIPETP